MLRALATFLIPLLVAVWLSVGSVHSRWVADAALVLAALVALLAIIAETPWGKRWGRLQQLAGMRMAGSFDGLPFDAPVGYQVRQLRQVVRRVGGTTDILDHRTLAAALKKIPRTGVDPMYEPLNASSVDEGLGQLVAEGLLEEVNKATVHYRIKQR